MMPMKGGGGPRLDGPFIAFNAWESDEDRSPDGDDEAA